MRFVAITDKSGATLAVEFGGQHEQRPMEILNVDEFIAVKSHRAKGKRISNYEVAKLTFIEPEQPEDEDIEDADIENIEDIEDDEPIDMEDIIGGDIKVDPNVDYTKRADVDDKDVNVSQLNLF